MHSRFVDQPAPQRFVGATSRLVVHELAIDADPAVNEPLCHIELLMECLNSSSALHRP